MDLESIKHWLNDLENWIYFNIPCEDILISRFVLKAGDFWFTLTKKQCADPFSSPWGMRTANQIRKNFWEVINK